MPLSLGAFFPCGGKYIIDWPDLMALKDDERADIALKLVGRKRELAFGSDGTVADGRFPQTTNSHSLISQVFLAFILTLTLGLKLTPSTLMKH